MKKTLGRCLPHHAPSELQRIIDNGFEARPVSVTPPGPHGPWTSPSVHAIHEPKRPAMHRRTCPPIIYIFLSYPQQSLSNSPCMAVSVDKWTRAMSKSSRLKWEMRSDPLRATIALPSALLKLPLRSAYFWNVLYSTQNIFRPTFEVSSCQVAL